jgi:hypothetical protein
MGLIERFLDLFRWRKGLPADSRPVWAQRIRAYRQNIALFSPMTEEVRRGDGPRAMQPDEVPGEGGPAFVPGINHSVPWPIPEQSCPNAATLWGCGSGASREFFTPTDCALRCVAGQGRVIVRVRRKDGGMLDSAASVDGRTSLRFGLLAIPRSGTYSIVVQAADRVDWGVTVVAGGPIVQAG